MVRPCSVVLSRPWLIKGTGAKIYDTRKTIPGWRALDKYAVRCGGGQNHRVGLYDGLLVKDNHVAAMPLRELSGFLASIVQRSRRVACAAVIQVPLFLNEGDVVKVDTRSGDYLGRVAGAA